MPPLISSGTVGPVLLVLLLGFAWVLLRRSDVRVRAQHAELRESETRHRTLFDHAGDAILIHDAEARMLAVNPRACEELGYTHAELMAMTIDQVDSPEQLQHLPDRIARLREHGHLSFETVHRRKDGSLVPTEVTARLITWNAQPAIMSICRDVTERKQAEGELHDTHDMMVKLTTQVPGVVYQYRLYPDGSSCFPYSSSGMNDIYEVTSEEVREDATPVFGRLHPDDLESTAAAIHESARTLELFHSEFRVVLPRQGLRWRMCDAKPERLPDGGTLWYRIITDITERKQAEVALRESEAKYRALIETTGTGYLVLDWQGRVIDANEEYVRLSGHGALPEILGRCVVEWTAEYEKQRNAEAVTGCMKDGIVRNLSSLNVTPVGQ